MRFMRMVSQEFVDHSKNEHKNHLESVQVKRFKWFETIRKKDHVNNNNMKQKIRGGDYFKRPYFPNTADDTFTITSYKKLQQVTDDIQ